MLSSILVQTALLATAIAGTPKPSDFEPHGVKVEAVEYKGRQALKVTFAPGSQGEIAILKGSKLKDGVIELDVAGTVAAGADPSSRGFIGVAFRVQPNAERYEAIYLRPTNGRADDQLRRNHSTQYVSHPDFPWFKLRKEEPGKYESYVDLEAGGWTKMKVVVKGSTAQLFVNDAAQPALIVNDLKLGPDGDGPVALWIGDGTEGYFSNLRITQ